MVHHMRELIQNLAKLLNYTYYIKNKPNTHLHEMPKRVGLMMLQGVKIEGDLLIISIIVTIVH